MLLTAMTVAVAHMATWQTPFAYHMDRVLTVRILQEFCQLARRASY